MIGFPGQYFDAETGLHQNHKRDYDPAIGRYLQPDPTGLDDGPNIYTYVGNNPVNWFDFDGEKRRRCPGRVFEILRQAVIVACKDTNTRCEDDDSCDEIKFKTTVKRLCIQAQEALTKACYPDDPSHKKRIEDTQRGIKRCQDIARRNNCECEAPSNGD